MQIPTKLYSLFVWKFSAIEFTCFPPTSCLQYRSNKELLQSHNFSKISYSLLPFNSPCYGWLRLPSWPRWPFPWMFYSGDPGKMQNPIFSRTSSPGCYLILQNGLNPWLDNGLERFRSGLILCFQVVCVFLWGTWTLKKGKDLLLRLCSFGHSNGLN